MTADVEPPAQDVLAVLPVAVLLIDGDDRVRNANQAAENLLNRSQQAMAGRPLAEVVRLPDAIFGGEGRTRDHGLWAFDVELALPHGRIRADLIETPVGERPGWRLLTLHHLASPYRHGHGAEPSGGALAAVGAAAILAHEIKNPLSGIRGAAQLLGSGDNSVEDAEALTRLIVTEVDRIAALIDGMQGFTDNRTLPIEAANIYPMLDHVRDVARAGFGSRVRFSEAYDPSLPQVAVNRDAFVQVLLNLVKNACAAAAGQEQPRVTIGTAFRHGVSLSPGRDRPRRSLPIEITVTDNGPGAPAEIAEHLFDPFVSGGGGQGLGLTLVDKLVRDMGGMVQYSREGSPEQTVFRIRLARADQP